MEAACSLDYINVLNIKGWYLNKSNVGLVVVCVDIFIVILLLCLLSYLRGNQRQVSEDIDAAEITASDFTVEIRNLPGENHDMTFMEFKAHLWQWIETTTKIKGKHYVCPDTGKPDENQDCLAALTFGTSDNGRIKILMQIAAV
jgi:hypothetical protein